MGQIMFITASFIFWITAVIHDAGADRIAWLLVDLLAWPIGVFRGIYLLLGGG